MQLSSDQLELQDLVRRFIQEAAGPEYIRKRIASGRRSDPALVERLSELGLEDSFGDGEGALGFLELEVIAEEVGRALLPESLIERLYCDRLVPRLLGPQSSKNYLEIGGPSCFAPSACCQVTADSGEGKVSGRIEWAYGTDGAAKLVGTLRVGGHRRVFVCSLLAPGVSVSPVTSLDLTTALSTISLKDVSATLLSESDSRIIIDCYEVLKAAEMYGITSRVVEMTAEYLRTREQFGVPIGAFQAIQQRIADAYATSESLGALCRFAGWAVNHSPEQQPLTARAVICHAVEVGPGVCEAAIQCHGGIGFTWEYDLHLFLRRAKTIQAGFPLDPERSNELLGRATQQ